MSHALDWIDPNDLAWAGLDAAGEIGAPCAEIECELTPDLPCVVADPHLLEELVVRLCRRALEVIGDDWGVVTVGSGLLGFGRTLLARPESLPAALPEHCVYLEIHSSGPAVGRLASSFTSDPFVASGFGPLDRDKAAALLHEMGGTIALDPFAVAGESALLLLPFASAAG